MAYYIQILRACSQIPINLHGISLQKQDIEIIAKTMQPHKKQKID